MDIPYTLYYVLIGELRSIIKEIFTKYASRLWVYGYVDLVHVVDLDDKPSDIPANVIAQIEVSYTEYSYIYGLYDVVEYVLLTDDCKFILKKPNALLETAISTWLLIVNARYLIYH
jgi:hypothetical protein